MAAVPVSRETPACPVTPGGPVPPARPLFETSGDRARERAAAAALGEAWWCAMLPAPPRAGFDYLAVRGERLYAVVEIKSRLNRAPGDYGGMLFLNAHKRDSLAAAAAALGLGTAIFAWHFAAEIRWVDVTRLAGRPAELRGRADRDGLDVRPALRVRLDETGRVVLDPPADRDQAGGG